MKIVSNPWSCCSFRGRQDCGVCDAVDILGLEAGNLPLFSSSSDDANGQTHKGHDSRLHSIRYFILRILSILSI